MVTLKVVHCPGVSTAVTPLSDRYVVGPGAVQPTPVGRGAIDQWNVSGALPQLQSVNGTVLCD